MAEWMLGCLDDGPLGWVAALLSRLPERNVRLGRGGAAIKSAAKLVWGKNEHRSQGTSGGS